MVLRRTFIDKQPQSVDAHCSEGGLKLFNVNLIFSIPSLEMLIAFCRSSEAFSLSMSRTQLRRFELNQRSCHGMTDSIVYFLGKPVALLKLISIFGLSDKLFVFTQHVCQLLQVSSRLINMMFSFSMAASWLAAVTAKIEKRPSTRRPLRCFH